MKATKTFTITKYKIDGTIYSFQDEKQARDKYKEMQGELSSNQKLEVTMTDSEVTEFDWSLI